MRLPALSADLEKRWVAAVKSGNIAAMQEMVREGVAVDAPLATAGGKTALAMMESERGDAARAMVEALLEEGADFKKSKVDLIWGVYFDKPRVVELLIDRGADVNFNPPRSMGPPLRLACKRGAEGIARMLIQAGADVNQGALSAAVGENFSEMAKTLIAAGAKPKSGEKLLEMALQKGNEDVALALIAAGADLDERSEAVYSLSDGPTEKQFEFVTPLMMAAALGQKKVAEALRAAGANVHLTDKAGTTALEWARRKGHKTIATLLEAAAKTQKRRVAPEVDLLLAAEKGEAGRVKELLAAGASVDARDSRPGMKGMTPLMLAARGGHLETLQLLLTAGADPAARDDTDPSSQQGFSFVANEMGVEGAMAAGFQMHRTALHWAAEKAAAALPLLLQHGADVNALDRAKMTPLMIAAEAGNGLAVEALLAGGADARIKGVKKREALHLAAAAGGATAVAALLKAEADVKAKDADGATALILAARRADPKTVALLLAAGADVNAQDREKETALAQVVGYRLMQKKFVGASRRIQVVLTRPADEMLQTVRLLVEAGADPLLQNKHGGSPMSRVKEAAKEHPFYEQALALLKAAKPQAASAPAPNKAPTKPEQKPKKALDSPAKAPDFTKAASAKEYQKALKELEQMCGAARQEMDDLPGGFMVFPHSEKAGTLPFDSAQERLLKAGCFIFQMAPEGGGAIGALPTKDPLDAILAMQTNGANYDVMPQDIVAWLRETAAEQPLILTGVGHDFVEARLVGKVKKAMALARRMAKICPDADEEVEGLAADLKERGRLFLWWD